MRKNNTELLREEKKLYRKKLVIVGLGKFWENRKAHPYLKKYNIVGYFDNSEEKQGNRIDGIQVKGLKEIVYAQYDIVVIMTMKTGEIKEQLSAYGVDSNKILSWDEFVFANRLENNDRSMAVIGAEALAEISEGTELFEGYIIEEVFTENTSLSGFIWGAPVAGLEKIKEKLYDAVLILDSNDAGLKDRLIAMNVNKDVIMSMNDLEMQKKEREHNKKEICLIGSEWAEKNSITEWIGKEYEVIAIFSDNEEQIGKNSAGIVILPMDSFIKYECEWYVCSETSIEKAGIIAKKSRNKKRLVSYEKFLELSNKKLKLLIFGTGLYLKNRISNSCFDLFEIQGFLDNDTKKWGTKLNDIDIVGPEEGIHREYDFIVIMSRFYDEMKTQLLQLGVPENKILSFTELCWNVSAIEGHGELPVERMSETEYKPLVSIIVPNYNHAPYLRERLESVYNQTYKNVEVLLLDDCSKDNSREILDEYAEKYSDITEKYYNEHNAGKAFLQWQKGIELAKGELIWIAESDDYSNNDFLEKMVQEFRRESVMLAFARSVFMKNGEQVWSHEEYLHDVPINWRKSFIYTAHEIVEKGFNYKNIIPNVSSAVFRNVEYIDLEIKEFWKQLNLCGDWMFYLSLIKGGCISYRADVTNYYRIHDGSTSLNVQKQFMYYREQAEISKYVLRNYRCDDKFLDKVLSELKAHYHRNFDDGHDEKVEEYYNISEIKTEKNKRKPNVAMCCFGICSGGGETYPLFLANEMKRKGITVTVFDFGMGQYNPEIRKKLNRNIPLVRMDSLIMLDEYVRHYGIEIAHSHHASVDEIVSDYITYNPKQDLKQFITLHGMYEAIDPVDAKRTCNKVLNTCRQFVYIADKNLIPFKKCPDFKNKEHLFKKLPNGLPQIKVQHIDRRTLGINDDDFVLCLVSRAIREKGWEEAVRAVEIAQNKVTTRKLHLLLIGDGEMREILEGKTSERVHFLGAIDNVRDYFTMSDIGLLPTYFKGESYPLVVIECLMCNRPVIATDIAEVKNQLTDENGELAGELIELEEGTVNVDSLAEIICRVATEEDYYRELKARTVSAAKKFDISDVTDSYLSLYADIM